LEQVALRIAHVEVSHGSLAAESVTQTCIVIGLEIDTHVVPNQLSCIWIASVKGNFTPAQRTAAIVVNGQCGHVLNFTGGNSSKRLLKDF
jgi:hypothetical protein